MGELYRLQGNNVILNVAAIADEELGFKKKNAQAAKIAQAKTENGVYTTEKKEALDAVQFNAKAHFERVYQQARARNFTKKEAKAMAKKAASDTYALEMKMFYNLYPAKPGKVQITY